MARLPNSDDALQFDNVNDYFRVVLSDSARLVVNGGGVVVPNDLTVSGNVNIVGTISPISGVFPNFNVTNTLHVSGAINNPVGSLILTSSVSDTVCVSGNLKVVRNAVVSGNLAVEGSVSNSSGFLILNDTTHVSGALTATSVTTTANVSGLTASFGNLSASGDLTCRGGLIRTYRFTSAALTGATSGLMVATNANYNTTPYSSSYVMLWAPNGGSILGASLMSFGRETITAGAITASVVVGTDTGAVGVLSLGSSYGMTQGDYTNKDRFPFVNGNLLSVTISASDGYTTSTSPLSCSWVVDVITEC